MEACAANVCYKLSSPHSKNSISFPHEITMRDYEVTVKAWRRGVLLKDFGKTCPANPFCDLIDCYLCWECIGNINCFPRMGLILIFALFFISSISLYYILRIIKLTYWFITVIFKFIIRLTKAIFRIVKWIKSKIEKRLGHRNVGRHILSETELCHQITDKLIHTYL